MPMTFREALLYGLSLALVAPLGATLAQTAPPDWENELILGRNKEATRATLVRYAEAATARTLDAAQAPFRISLNGDWKIHWVPHPDQRPQTFFEDGYDDSGWDTIPVPSNVELHGYGTPIYVNTKYPLPPGSPPGHGRAAGRVHRTPGAQPGQFVPADL